MLIKEVKIHLIEMEGKRPIRTMFVIPGQLRSQFDRRATPGHEPNQLCFIRVITDTGIEGWSTAFYTWGPARAFAETWLDAFRHELVGADPLDREYIFQMAGRTAPGVGHYSTQKTVRYPGYSNSGIGMGIRRISPCGDPAGSRRSGYCAGRRNRIGRNYGIDEGSACGRSIRSGVRGTRARTNVLLCPCTGAGRDEQLRVF